MRRRAFIHRVAVACAALVATAVAAAAQQPPSGGRAAREQARQCERLNGEPAIAACRQAITLGLPPARERALRDVLAAQLVRLERWDELADVLRESVRRQPSDATAWSRLGTTLLFALGEAAEATAALQQAVRLAPGDAEARLALGLAHAASGRPREAVAEIEQAHELAPGLLDERPAAREALEAARAGRTWPLPKEEGGRS
jgi:Flp pilus assembly protein TadD